MIRSSLSATGLNGSLCRLAIFSLMISSGAGFAIVDGQEADTVAQPQSATVVTVSPGGVQRFARGGWASLSVVGANPTDRDVEEVISVFVAGDPSFQFSKTFWVPAGGQRQTWLPVEIPADVSQEFDRVELSTIRILETDVGETFDQNLLQTPISDRSVMLLDNEINTGLIADPPDIDFSMRSEERRTRLNAILDVARDSATSSPSDLPIVNFTSNFLPPSVGALDELDQIVIAGDHLLSDSEGMVSLRRWIRGGGRAWVMLDLTSQATVDGLLGDQADYSVVDRVELNEYEMVTSDPIKGRSGSTQRWTSESPVELLRVLTDCDDVSCRIDGWPAAFWIRVGEGEVLFTTLGGPGWMKSQQQVGEGLYLISRRFFEPRIPPNEMISAMKPMVDDQIGYEIPSRGLAALVLGLNALVILVAGCWWARERKLERMAILVPASAIITTAVMLSIGSYHARAVPSTVATTQVVQIRSATGEADVSGLHAVYSQQSGPLGLVAGHQVQTMPMERAQVSETQRVRWDDSGSSRWIGPGQPPGVVRHLVSNSVIPLTQPIAVRGSFDAEGFRGTLIGLDPANCQDGLIVALPGPMASVELDASLASGQVGAATTALLPPDQFIPGSLLSDQQRMRQEFLREVFSATEGNRLGAGPSLLLWTDPFDLGVEFAERFKQSGTALVSIPIQITTPSPGAEFRVPMPFVRTDTFYGERGRTTTYNPRNGQWLKDLTKPVEVELLFQYPRALSAMKLTGVAVTIKVNAPSRTLFVKALVDGQPVTVFQQDNPSGLVQFTIDREEALRLHSDGGLWLAIGISESLRAAELRAAKANSDETESESESEIKDPVIDTTTWQIDYVHLDTAARIESSSLTSNIEASETGKP